MAPPTGHEQRSPHPGADGRLGDDSRGTGVTAVDGEGIRASLIRQWLAVAAAIPRLDLDRPSRVMGWRNREVLAHLYVQPVLVSRLVASASNEDAEMGIAANLSGTGEFSDLIDTSARGGAASGKFDLAVPLSRTIPVLAEADLTVTITTLQGRIALIDYLVTRCVEAVVHGGDLVDPVTPDQTAQSIAAAALMDVLATKAPELVILASRLPEAEWIACATGRTVASGDLASGLPVMT